MSLGRATGSLPLPRSLGGIAPWGGAKTKEKVDFHQGEQYGSLFFVLPAPSRDPALHDLRRWSSPRAAVGRLSPTSGPKGLSVEQQAGAAHWQRSTLRRDGRVTSGPRSAPPPAPLTPTSAGPPRPPPGASRKLPSQELPAGQAQAAKARP